MKNLSINIYPFNELNGESRQRAINEHYNFLASEGIEVENENGEMIREEYEPTESEVIESILINEYRFYHDGEIAPCTTYTGKHPLAPLTIYTGQGANEIVKVGSFNFYPPVEDSSGKVQLMYYCNNGMAYGIEQTNQAQHGVKWHLCSAPTLQAVITEIISSHDTFDEMRHAFFKLK